MGTIASLVAAGLAFAVCSEIFARIWLRRHGYFVYKPWDRVRMRLDQGELPGMEPVVYFEVNEDGERGDPLPKDRRGLYRVLVAGGSSTECRLLDQDTAWPAVVQRLLNRRECLDALGATRVHAGNVGRSLTPAASVRQILERTLPRYGKLDVLIVMVGVSDAIEWMERGAPARMPAAACDTPRPFSEDPAGRFDWRRGRFAVGRAAGLAWRRALRPVRARPDCGRKLGELRLRRRQATGWVHELPDSSEMLAHLEANLRRIVALGLAKAHRVIVVRQPWFDRPLERAEEPAMWSFCRGRLFGGESREYFTHAAARELLGQIDRRVAGVATETGAEQLNLRPLIEAGLVNYYDFMHFTPAGARRVGQAVAAAVLEPLFAGDIGRLSAAMAAEETGQIDFPLPANLAAQGSVRG